MEEARATKRVRLDIAEQSDAMSSSARDISPPLRSREICKTTLDEEDKLSPQLQHYEPSSTISSPFQLSKIEDLPAEANVDTVSLADILGDPLIEECWNFNYLFDLDFVMNHLDKDVRHLVRMKVIHGFWKRDSENRLSIEEAATHWPNVQLITAYMPEAFGTHHSKMMILFRHDNTAQVIVHTANMISRDWTNMTQAIWRSEALLREEPETDFKSTPAPQIGSGNRFKNDLLTYIRAYADRLSDLSDRIGAYDFSTIRAAFICSTPGRHSLGSSFGWCGLRNILKNVSCTPILPTSKPNIVAQVSSIASLGTTDAWLKNLLSTMSTAKRTGTQLGSRPLKTQIVFPTANEIRNSLDGYFSGGSIHMKLSSTANHTQLAYLRPYLHHWGPTSSTADSSTSRRDSMRDTAAPHIKTYVRFADADQKDIDWAMLTSANLSTQAWGALSKDGRVRVCSYETGVVVWPALWDDDTGKAKMVGVWGKDLPENEDDAHAKRDKSEVYDPDATTDEDATEDEGEATEREVGTKLRQARGERARRIVGLRIPYTLPLEKYQLDDIPWVASATYKEPDRYGRFWK